MIKTPVNQIKYLRKHDSAVHADSGKNIFETKQEKN
jgi:hypothetical protein